MANEQAMNDKRLEQEALDLIEMAHKLLPEGEGLDLTDREYIIEDIIRLGRTLSGMRSAIDKINAALAGAWWDEYGDVALTLDEKHYWLAPPRKVKIQPGMEDAFFDWLKDQDNEIVAAVVPAHSLRVTRIPPVMKDTCLDIGKEEPTAANVRIQNKPALLKRKKKK
jgi:hypothetical protein